MSQREVSQRAEGCIRRGRVSQRERAEGCTQRGISVAEALQRRLYLQREGVAEALKTVFAEGGVA